MAKWRLSLDELTAFDWLIVRLLKASGANQTEQANQFGSKANTKLTTQ